MRHLFVSLAVVVPSLAFADLTMVSEVVSGGKTRVVTLSAKGGRGSFEMKEPDGTTRTMLRDGAAKKLFIIDHEKKVVMVVTEEDSKAQEERQAQMKAQLEAQLARMPPEQRARIEQGMLGAGAEPRKKLPPYTYEKKKSAARKVGAFSCEDYVIKREGVVKGEACFASWKTLGISAADFQRTIGDATPKMSAGPMGLQAHTPAELDAEAAAPGLPVWRKLFDERGEVTAETTVTSLSKATIDAGRFEVPKDYQLKNMADLVRPPAPTPRK